MSKPWARRDVRDDVHYRKGKRSPRLAVAPEADATAPAGARRVLIVEDEEILAENLKTYVQRRGWLARVASNGLEAIIAANEFRPQVILLDYRLPDMDGFQALDAIRTNRKACGCILMTAEPTDIVADGALWHGIEHILSKPFALGELELCLLAVAADLPVSAIPDSRAHPSGYNLGLVDVSL